MVRLLSQQATHPPPAGLAGSISHGLPLKHHKGRNAHHHQQDDDKSEKEELWLLLLPKAPKSGALVAPWVRIDREGNSSVLHEGRVKLIMELGIQGRDLRLLEEPPLGGAFLVREDAIIASLDFACIIITTQAAYVVNPAEPPTVRFMAALQQRLAFAAAGGGGGGGGGVPNTWQEREQQLLVRAHAQGARPNAPGQPLATGDPSPAHLFHTAVFSALGDAQPAGADPPPPLLPLLRPEAAVLPKRLGKEQQKGKAKMAPQAPLVMPVMQSMEAQPLPFELRVLELCLHEMCSSLTLASTQLEATAMPLVDVLLNKAEVAVLENLRVAKQQLAELTTKAVRVCSQLKSLLDDDNDMWGMHLTAKEAQRAAVQEAAARMMAEVNAMGGHPALGARRLEKVEEEEAEMEPRVLPREAPIGMCQGLAASAPSTQWQQQQQQPSPVPSAACAGMLGDALDGPRRVPQAVHGFDLPQSALPLPTQGPPFSSASSTATTSQGIGAAASSGRRSPPAPQLPLSSTSDSPSDEGSDPAVPGEHLPDLPPQPPLPPPAAPPPPSPFAAGALHPQGAGAGGHAGSGGRGGLGGSLRLSAQNLRRLGEGPPQSIGAGQRVAGSPGGWSGRGKRGSVRGHSDPSGSSSSSSSSSSSGEFEQAVSQVEMLVESYYLQLDVIYNRLKAVQHYIEDAEDMVQLHLDATQNVLLTRDLVFSVVAAVCGVLFSVAQFFTMNMEQGPFQAWPWFFDFYAPIVVLGSWILMGGAIILLIRAYLHRAVTGKSWFSQWWIF